MAITPEANQIIIDTVVANTIDNIDVISVRRATGEFFRKVPADIETISSTERKYTFYMNEEEANDVIIGLDLWGNGATTALGSGTKMATQDLVNSIDKSASSQSLLVYWTVKVVSES